MKIQEVRDALYRELAPLLPGWKLVKKEQGFMRAFAGGRQGVFVPIWDYNPEFKFSLAFGTRLDAAEALVHRVSGVQGADQKASMTMVTQLAYFFSGEQKKQIRVTTPEDAANRERLHTSLREQRTRPENEKGSRRCLLGGGDKGERTRRNADHFTLSHVALQSSSSVSSIT